MRVLHGNTGLILSKVKSSVSEISFTLFLVFTTQSRLLRTPEKKPFENIVGKGENAGNQHFLIFQQCFPPIPKIIFVFKLHLFCHLQMVSIWTSLKLYHLVNG